MPLKSLTAQAASIAAMYGPDRAAHMPDTVFCHLFTEDPDDGGVEITTDPPASLSSDLFPSFAALVADGALLETPDFVWTSTAAWSAVATYAEIRDAAGVRYDGAALRQRINVTEVGTVVRANSNIFYNELGA